MPDEPALPPAIKHHLAMVPEKARIRGMFYRWVDEFCLQQSLPILAERKIDFKLYSAKEYLGYLLRAITPIAERIGFPEALRLHGQFIFPNFMQTLLGRSITAAVLTPKAMMKVAPRSYKMLTEGVKVDVAFLTPTSIEVSMHDLWIFNDSFGVGTWEGVLKALKLDGEVKVVLSEGPATTRLRVNWLEKHESNSADGISKSSSEVSNVVFH